MPFGILLHDFIYDTTDFFDSILIVNDSILHATAISACGSCRHGLEHSRNEGRIHIFLLIAAAGAAVGGVAGGIIGALTDSGVSERDAHVYAEGIRRGGALVTARVSDELAPMAERILGQSTAVDLDSRRRDYEAEGWTAFDPDAPAYRSGKGRRVP